MKQFTYLCSMTADEARRLTISNYPAERLQEYIKLQELIKHKCENPSRPTFEVRIKGQLQAATQLCLEIDGYRYFYDDSDLVTTISWMPESEFYKNFRIEKAIKDLREYMNKRDKT